MGAYERYEHAFGDGRPICLRRPRRAGRQRRRRPSPRAREVDPRRVEVDPVPRPAGPDPRARPRLPRPDDLHAARDALASRARLRRPPARLSDRRSQGARRARPPRGRAPPDRHGRLARAPRPHRGGRRSGPPADPRLHRPGLRLLDGRRASQDRGEALAGPHAGAGRRARARDRQAGLLRARRADGLRGSHRRPRRRPSGPGREGRRDPPDAEGLRARAGRAAGCRGRGGQRRRPRADRQRRRDRQPGDDRGGALRHRR